MGPRWVLIYFEDSLKQIGFLLFPGTSWIIYEYHGLLLLIAPFFGEWLTVRRIASHATHRWNNKKNNWKNRDSVKKSMNPAM